MYKLFVNSTHLAHIYKVVDVIVFWQEGQARYTIGIL